MNSHVQARPVSIGGIYDIPQKTFGLSTPARMYLTALCAFAVVLQSSLSDNFASMWVALAAVFAALFGEALLGLITGRRTLQDGSALVTALVMTMLLPNTINPAFAAGGAFFAVVVIKFPFGGLGANWLNPALGGAMFVRFSWSAAWKSALSESPLASQGFDLARTFVSSRAQEASAFLNEKVFSLFGVRVPPLYIDLFAWYPDGLIGDRGLYALAAGSIFIIALGVSFRAWGPFFYLALYLVLVRVWGDAAGANGDMLYALCTGGTFAAAFYLLCDPVSGAKSPPGTFLYAASLAALTFIFRYLKGELYGAFFAVFFLNALLPVLRTAERFFYEKRGMKQAAVLQGGGNGR